MEVRFIILHPEDPGEILLATSLIRCLKTQVEEAYVYSIVSEEYRWLLESDTHLEGLFVYQNDPKELLDPLRDFLPDYLIDLNGGREVRRFKNRLKVMDFTINRRLPHISWAKRAFETCTLFDVQDDGLGPKLQTAAHYRELLPGSFLDGYLVLSLAAEASSRQISDDQIIEMVVMIEKPIVVTGERENRPLADRIGQSTGCAVFPTCGDFTRDEIAAVMNHAKGIITFDPVWDLVANAMGISSLMIREKKDPAQLKEIALWARSLFKKSHDRNPV